jgi:hypothetical protein
LQTRLKQEQWFAKELAKDETITIRLDDPFHIFPPAKFGGADISIIIEYDLWIVPKRFRTEFRYVTRVENDGRLSWVPRPVNK